MQTTTINRRQYQVEPLPTGALASQDLKSRGWDGQSYMVTGKRGATYLAYRNAKTGEFSIV